MSIRIMITDDHQVVREGFRSILEAEGDLEVVGETGDGRSAVALAAKVKPDVVVMDVSMPGLNGIEATRQIVAERPSTRVIGLSMHARQQYVSEMLRAGASGYLLKDSPSQELLTAIRTVAAGRTFLSPAVAGSLVESFVVRPSAEPSRAFALLSDREREVLQLIAEGMKVREIADLLHLSANTIHTHRRHIMEKLGIQSVAQLTKFAIREGLTEV